MPKGLQLKKSLATIENILDFCCSNQGIEKTKLFPAYLDLDTDPSLDETSNPLHELKTQKADIEEKLLMLEATERQNSEQFSLVDEEGHLDLDYLYKLKNKQQTIHANNIKEIATSVRHLVKLGSSAIMARDFGKVDADRTVDLGLGDLDLVKESMASSVNFNTKRFELLAQFRSLDHHFQKLDNLAAESNLPLT